MRFIIERASGDRNPRKPPVPGATRFTHTTDETATTWEIEANTLAGLAAIQDLAGARLILDFGYTNGWHTEELPSIVIYDAEL